MGTWCPSTGKCIRVWEDKCPVEDGEQFEGPIGIDCNSDMQCSMSDECIIERDGVTYFGYYWEGQSGTMNLPTGCTANCTGCQEIKDGSGRRLRGSPVYN